MNLANIKITTRSDLKKVPTKALLDYYNTELGKTISKFASRVKGEEQVWKLLQENLGTGTGTVSEGKGRAMSFDFPAKDEIKGHRENTKRAKTLEKLLKGATFEEIKQLNDWDDRTAYEGIRLLHIKLGYGLSQDPDSGVIKAFTKNH